MTGRGHRLLPADRSRALAALLLALAAAAYTLAAWSVKPGFYDGIGGCSPVPYRWMSPPPPLAGGNLKPLSGHATARVIGGEVQGVFAFTDDNQVQLSVPAGGFNPPAGSTVVTISIDPVSTSPAVTDFSVSTNVYRITASAPLVKEAHVVMQYTDQLAAPSTIYMADEGGSTWRPLPPVDSGLPCQLSAKTTKLGLFVAGYPRAATRPSGFTIGGAVLPIVAAAAVILVLLSAVPIAILRQRQSRPGSKSGRAQR
jgi:hypothetical protein